MIEMHDGTKMPQRLPGHKLTMTWSGEYGIESSSTGTCSCGWEESASNQREVRHEYHCHLKRVWEGHANYGVGDPVENAYAIQLKVNALRKRLEKKEAKAARRAAEKKEGERNEIEGVRCEWTSKHGRVEVRCHKRVLEGDVYCENHRAVADRDAAAGMARHVEHLVNEDKTA